MRSLGPVLAGLIAMAPVRGAAQSAPAPSLTLAGAVQRATERAPGIEAASFRVDEARSRVGEARAQLLPSFSVAGTWLNRSENLAAFGLTLPGIAYVQPFNNWDARVRVDQAVLDLSGWQHLRAQGYQTTGSVADRAAAVQAAAGAAALAYLRAVRAASLLAARQADQDIAAQLLSLADAQVQAGVSAPLDATRARTQLVAAQGALIVARNQRQKADIDLALALGADPGTTYRLADTLTGDLGASLAPADTVAALALALERRADLASETAAGDRARAEGRSIAYERLPRIDLAADYGPNGMTVPTTRLTQDVALVVSIPLLDGFRREARGAEQRAVAQESDARAGDLRRRIAAQVRSALLDLGSGIEQHGVAAQRLALAMEELDEARERFASGVAGNIDVITAQSNLNLARDVEIDSRYATAAARVSLAFAAGVADTVH
ncbi:MAG TPA: TolC family protein [Gemmatimonadales bacterium]|nr:TolC family protein [Gemmatimonadales bacterium]